VKTQTIEPIDFFSEAELESLEFVPEELEAIEAERVPDLDSISFEDIAKDLEAYFEGEAEGARLEARGGRRKRENRAAQRPRRITDADYNNARQILVNAGSRTAQAAHPRHGNAQDNPVHFGLQLLREARIEFGGGRNQVQSDALRRAAAVMGLQAQPGRAVW
jgi:hypothetical protein